MITVNDMHKLEWQQGMTVGDVMKELGYNYSLITVTVNGEYVDPDSYDSHEVPDKADMKAIHIAHGG